MVLVVTYSGNIVFITELNGHRASDRPHSTLDQLLAYVCNCKNPFPEQDVLDFEFENEVFEVWK